MPQEDFEITTPQQTLMKRNTNHYEKQQHKNVSFNVTNISTKTSETIYQLVKTKGQKIIYSLHLLTVSNIFFFCPFN